MRHDIEVFINNFTKELLENNAAVFAGAGLSVPLGYVNWRELLRPLADEMEIDIEKVNDLVSLAQYYCNEKCGNRHKINQLIFDEFNRQTKQSVNHEILARLPIDTYWTTNYDSIIEDSLKEEGKIPDVKYTVEQLALTKPKRDAIVYKMHGDKEHPSNAIVIKDDYESYHIKYAPFINALAGDLVSKTFLFLGFSFSDPNLDYILSRVRITFNNNQRSHYCILKETKEEEYKDKPQDFNFEKRKQELFIRDLMRFNIQTLLVDDYSEITSILSIIEKNINRNNVFISGSAHTFDPCETGIAEEFIRDLSKKIIKNDFNIISGFGLGLGDLVVSGALEEIYSKIRRVDNNRLLLRPFPQKVSFNIDRDELWDFYRRDMISRAGITIILFGNKIEDNNLINAGGVYKEFLIAKEKGNLIVPVGATGYMAKVIWNEVNDNFDEYYPNCSEQGKKLFQNLNDSEINSEKLIDTILDFINLFRKEYI